MFIKRNSVFLNDIIPDNYVDIHSHILPGIDDGAKSIEDSLFLINEFEKLGIKKCIATPHIMSSVWENSANTILPALDCVQKSISNSKVFSIKAAAEYMMDDNFVKLFKSGDLLTLKDNYVLVEMSYLNMPINLYEIIFELQVAGYKPVLAHPERYTFFHNRTDEYVKLKKSGCSLQLNLLSSTGYYGDNVSKCADFLLKNNLIDFVGSDVHHKKHIDFFYKKIILKNIESLKLVAQNNCYFEFD